MSKSVGQFLKDTLAGLGSHPPVPRCPECMRTSRRSVVHRTGHSRIRAGAIEITRGTETTVAKARQVLTLTYRCANSHQWTETNIQELP